MRVSIAGASGYAGGEILRLLLGHDGVELSQVSSEQFRGKPVTRTHPNLRGHLDHRFCSLDELEPCDLLFACLPHGGSSAKWDQLAGLAPKMIDLSADYRLKDLDSYARYYKTQHPRPEPMAEFVYGIPELNREAIRQANRVACAGCNATTSILGLFPLARKNLLGHSPTVVDVKVGSSEAGRRSSSGSHHPERSGAVRSFAPTGHRHTAEIVEALGLTGAQASTVHMSVTAIEMVRGAVATSHVLLDTPMEEKEIWQIFRQAYADEPFMRLVKEMRGHNRYPDPKLLAGTNYCDVGFELDADSRRLVVISAIDNLMKGAAGQAVQCMNLMLGMDETTALSFPGLHPS